MSFSTAGAYAEPAEPGLIALDVVGIKKSYNTASGPVEVVENLTFSVRKGEFVCIVGPSGSGKTTLLRCIAGLTELSGGEVILDGRAISGPPAGMAIVFQDYGRSLFPWLTVRENVELPLKEKGLPRSERRKRADAALEAVGLPDSAHAHPWQLSGGMQQRVAIARAVAYEPSVLLMDEPFAAVDAQTRAEIQDLVRSLWERLGVTVLFVTHDIDEAVYLAQRVVVLSNKPTVVLEEVFVDLPTQRDQLSTRTDPRFADLRAHVYSLIQLAKRGKEAMAPELRATSS
ncbi:ABC transporter ATP-binding protein [Arthrobacter sp. MA-N2]|uniref:ABC transporter ATP-binding protein n=1 Tax=Arthrobacter sp. MA-N2 TaxID=1101188 RepID=UPI0004BA4BA1|nr:ABC transporter ATP-binding protein [Arthrobacter sp. MA-N2]